MESTDIRGSASITIAATPAEVWSAVSDVTVLGSLSPECHRCEWTDRGRQFVGHNKMGSMEWSTVCDVITSVPEQEFAFQSGAGDERYTEWRYLIEPAEGGGTQVTESFRVIKEPPQLEGAGDDRKRGRQEGLLDGVRRTLATLKDHVEGKN